MSWPGITVSDTDASRSGGLSLGSSAPAEATIRRAVRPGATSACNARALAEAMSKWGASPRYGSTSCDGNGRTTRSTSASERPSSAAKKKRASWVVRSTSASVATTRRVRPRAAEAAAYIAFAAGVRPLTRAAGAPAPIRPAAVLSSARSVRELEVYVDMGAIPAGAGTHHYSRCLLRLPTGFRPVGLVGSILTRTRAALLLKGRVTFLTVVGRIPRKSG